jgi:hypothetical protein
MKLNHSVHQQIDNKTFNEHANRPAHTNETIRQETTTN